MKKHTCTVNIGQISCKLVDLQLLFAFGYTRQTCGLQVLGVVGEVQLETPVLLLYSVGSWLLLETRCLRDGAGAPCAVHDRTYTTARVYIFLHFDFNLETPCGHET
jgi:hypothetical protein